MRTRAEIYGNEAATLLRTVTMYPGLSQQQLLCFHPGKSETAKALLSHLESEGDTNNRFAEPELNRAVIVE